MCSPQSGNVTHNIKKVPSGSSDSASEQRGDAT